MQKHTFSMVQQKRLSLFVRHLLVLCWLLVETHEQWSVVAASGNDYAVGYCAPYHGKVCKSFITSTQVWYNKVSNRREAISVERS